MKIYNKLAKFSFKKDVYQWIRFDSNNQMQWSKVTLGLCKMHNNLR